jgi:drug/metabolite transporter (DMT)-like permease
LRSVTAAVDVSRRGLVLFAAVSIIWGVPYLFIRIAVRSVSPAFVAWSRVTIGAALLLPVALQRGSLRGLWSRRAWLVAFAALEMALPFLLIAWGERYVASSLAAILVASLPIIVAAFSARFDPVERRAGGRLIGLAVGMLGVVLLVGVDFAGDASELVGAIAILTAACCYAGGSLIVKRQLSDLQPLGPVAAALALSSLMLIPSAVSLRPEGIPSADALASIAVLGLICSAVALILYFALITEVGPGRATVIGYTTPVVAVVLGVALLDERLTASAIAGVVLILAGSYLATRDPESRSSTHPEAEGGAQAALPANGLKELVGQRARQSAAARQPVAEKGDHHDSHIRPSRGRAPR